LLNSTTIAILTAEIFLFLQLSPERVSNSGKKVEQIRGGEKSRKKAQAVRISSIRLETTDTSTGL